MDGKVALLNAARSGTDTGRTDRSGLRPPTVLAVAALHLALLCAFGLLFHARQTPPPPQELSIPVVFMPAAPAPPDPVPQILAPSRLAVPTTEEPATLASLPTLTLPASPAGLTSPLTPHRRVSQAKPLEMHTPTDQAAKPDAPPAAHPVSAPPAPQTSPHAMANWEARIRQAVQDAAIYPVAARLLHRDGSAQIRFDYDRGAIENAIVAQTSHVGALDNAALAAVTRAAIPAPPAELGPQKRTMLVWVQFRLVSEE